MSAKQIVFVEPFYAGSHKNWTDSYIRILEAEGHEVELLSLKGRNWKWRMYGSALSLGKELLGKNLNPDILICSDMLDLSAFCGVARSRLQHTKIILYFHENQLTYPWSPTDEDTDRGRDVSYAYINYRSACVADKVFFNSEYHKKSFLGSLRTFLKRFPDDVDIETIAQLEKNSEVLHLGIDLTQLLSLNKKRVDDPTILWNHRWEYDKNPELFYQGILNLKKSGAKFKLIVCGESSNKYPQIFDMIKDAFAEELIHFGYADSKDEYVRLLQLSDILPVTNIQDFFGGSVVEGIAAGCIPLLPSRLAYPEHVKKDLQEKFFYSKDEDFSSRLKELVENFNDNVIFREILRSEVSKYDWHSVLRDKYLSIVND